MLDPCLICGKLHMRRRRWQEQWCSMACKWEVQRRGCAGAMARTLLQFLDWLDVHAANAEAA